MEGVSFQKRFMVDEVLIYQSNRERRNRTLLRVEVQMKLIKLSVSDGEPAHLAECCP